ncbi:CDP-alcohol phosphatidyltransferase family protein [Clostridium botulinum]|uniref:CDP-alcohol phosphatidyltransferase family protein n=2 Tax=Clostridium botulinum TaxID=1491 RepID=UPI00019DB7D9|nr:CDP-alcohol phosphatidyltransferase family protein [Clostridium botulinum]EEZ28423.1 D-proline reductase proprotein PrdA [Clostridium botulinum Bf]
MWNRISWYYRRKQDSIKEVMYKPNCISFSRIIFSLILIYAKPLSLVFYVIYIICGFSDIIDGLIARKTGTMSSLGAKIDSVADMIMVCVLLFLIYTIVNLTSKIVIWIILISIIRLESMFIAMKKYKIFASVHTYGNKITGIVLFLFSILLLYGYLDNYSIQEVDLGTGKLLFFWNVLTHVNPADSMLPASSAADSNNIWDCFHVNSIEEGQTIHF